MMILMMEQEIIALKKIYKWKTMSGSENESEESEK